MSAKGDLHQEAIAAVLATLGPDCGRQCVTEREIARVTGVPYEITAKARDAIYGRRGGGWAPALTSGQAPFGVIKGKRKDCPTPVAARCGCGVRWWVVPSQVGKACPICLVDLVPERRAA